ncbi:MAG: hypothetical protein ACOX1P_08550 [Thermoguttaceae bacterium]
MGACAVADGHFGRRAALAINLALHPDEPDGGERVGLAARGPLVAVNLALHPDEPDGGRAQWPMGILGGGRR